jgi:hypothetical protein
MRVAVHQPNFLPRLKVLQKLAAADVWVVLDNVQYCSREWQNRTRLVSFHGISAEFWFTAPVKLLDGRRTLIKDVQVLDAGTLGQRLSLTMRHSFRSAPHWDELAEFLSDAARLLCVTSLTTLCVQTTLALLRMHNCEPEIRYASELRAGGCKSALQAAICHELGATAYIADTGASKYLREADFGTTEVLWHHWTEPSASWPGISSWRGLSSINFLAREGRRELQHHLHAAGTLDHVRCGLELSQVDKAF